MADEAHVPLLEPRVLEEPRLARRPEHETHPDPGVVQLEVVSDCLGGAFGRHPRGMVRRGTVVHHHPVPFRHLHGLSVAGLALLGPRSTRPAHFLDDPIAQPHGVGVVIAPDELVEVLVRECLGVEKRSHLVDLGSPSHLLQKPRRPVGYEVGAPAHRERWGGQVGGCEGAPRCTGRDGWVTRRRCAHCSQSEVGKLGLDVRVGAQARPRSLGALGG
mmetsp:Transcript_42796/g.101840  ORF Transcript_42796/g.101840 Transcript_42796/m.101840 type:complete len:217 (-) Transcript_42796:302-952(-)